MVSFAGQEQGIVVMPYVIPTTADTTSQAIPALQQIQQLELELQRLQSALALRSQDARPLNHSVVTAYRTQIARIQAAQASLPEQ